MFGMKALCPVYDFRNQSVNQSITKTWIEKKRHQTRCGNAGDDGIVDGKEGKSGTGTDARVIGMGRETDHFPARPKFGTVDDREAIKVGGDVFLEFELLRGLHINKEGCMCMVVEDPRSGRLSCFVLNDIPFVFDDEIEGCVIRSDQIRSERVSTHLMMVDL